MPLRWTYVLMQRSGMWCLLICVKYEQNPVFSLNTPVNINITQRTILLESLAKKHINITLFPLDRMEFLNEEKILG